MRNFIKHIVIISSLLPVLLSASPKPASNPLSIAGLMDNQANFKIYLEAKEQINISEKAIAERQSIYQLLLNNQPAQHICESLLQLEKKFSNKISNSVPDWKVEEAYNSLNINNVTDTQELLIRQALRSHLYFSDPQNISEAQNQMEMELIKNQAEEDEAHPALTIAELRIKANPDGCVASFQSKDCFITVKEFNNYLPLAGEQRNFTLEEARKNILENYAFQKLKAKKSQELNPDIDKDELLKKVKEGIEYYETRKALLGMGRPVTDPKILFYTYQKYYKQYFSGRDSVLMKVLASSDSNYIKSLYNNYAEPVNKAISNNQPHNNSTIDSLAWLKFNEWELPLELVAPTDTFYEGQITKPIQTNSGYFLVRLEKIVSIPKIEFKDAHSKCIYLATRDKFLNYDSVINEKAFDYYQKNKSSYVTPDTVLYQFWLAPKNSYSSVEAFTKDTNSILPLIKRDTDLPFSMIDKYAINNKTHELQIYNHKFGQMLVKILEVKKGRLKVPYSHVKAEILQKIIPDDKIFQPSYANISPEDSLLREKIYIDMGTRNLIFKNIEQEIEGYTDEEIKMAMENGEIELSKIPSDLDEERRIVLAKQNLKMSHIEKAQMAIEEKYKSLKFATDLLATK